MKTIVTGADRPLGALLCCTLEKVGEIVPIGGAAVAPDDLGGREYRCVDLCAPEEVAKVVQGAGALVHALPFEPPEAGGDAQAGAELLDQIARGTYVVVSAACEAGIKRLVLISQMALLQDYPDDYILSPDWRPLPRAEADSLAPYTAELVCREIARTGKIEVVCLRLGSLDAEGGTRAADAVEAVAAALCEDEPGRGHNWILRHVV